MMEINVCIGTSCHLNGSYNIVQTFQQLIEEYSLHEKIDFKANFCMKQCQNKGVSVRIDEEVYRIGPEDVRGLFQSTILNKLK